MRPHLSDGRSSGPADGSRLSRRALLQGSTLCGAAALVAACSGGSGRASPATTAPPTTAAPPGDDARTAAFVAGLELLALRTYDRAVQVVNAGAVPTPPAALGQLVNVAVTHHQQHLDAWNGVLRTAGKPEVTEPPPSLTQALQANLQGLLSAGIARTALSVEQLLAASYVSAVPSIQGADAVRLAGSIEAVELEHAALIRFLLSQPAAPDAFASDAFSLGG